VPVRSVRLCVCVCVCMCMCTGSRIYMHGCVKENNPQRIERIGHMEPQGFSGLSSFVCMYVQNTCLHVMYVFCMCLGAAEDGNQL
jgi:hypothetical protein